MLSNPQVLFGHEFGMVVGSIAKVASINLLSSSYALNKFFLTIKFGMNVVTMTYYFALDNIKIDENVCIYHYSIFF
jgi:hypothetical protein